MPQPVKLIAGIGNPGQQYADTRHNAGVWLVNRLVERLGGQWKEDKKFFCHMSTVNLDGHELKVVVPTTYMNESGKCLGAVARFYRIEAEELLIAHDELDLPIGTIKFKAGGGLAGHNGLRSISAALGNQQGFNRIRIGVGHPGTKEQVTGHVLGKVSRRDADLIDACIDEALHFLPVAVEGDWEKAMTALNGFKADNAAASE